MSVRLAGQQKSGRSSPAMIGISNEDSRARQDADATGGAAASRKTLCEILPHECKTSGKIRLWRNVACEAGGNFEVRMDIALTAGLSLDARTLSGIMCRSVARCFEYAVASSHAKTIVSTLSDHEGRAVGEIVAAFRLARQSPPVPDIRRRRLVAGLTGA